MKQTIFKLVFSGLLLSGSATVASAQTTFTSAQATSVFSGAKSAPPTRDFFDKKGRHLYSIAYYGEKELPAEIRAIVKPVYYDYAIKTVEELRIAGKSVYFVDMQDDSHVKTVKVVDGEMEEVSSFQRGIRR